MNRAWTLGAAVAAALTVAAPASAATFCVSDPACPAGGVSQSSVGAAVAAANASSANDLIRVGPGDFSVGTGVALGSGASVDALQGAGSAQTRLTGPVTVRASSVVRAVTLRMAAGQTRAAISEAQGGFDGVAVDGSAVTGDDVIGFDAQNNPGPFRHGSITLAKGMGAFGNGAGAGLVEDTTIDAPVGAGASYYGLKLHRVSIFANVGVKAPDGAMSLDAVAIRLKGTDPYGLRVGPGTGSTPYPLVAHHLTIVGTGSGTGVAAFAGCGSETKADVRVDHVAIGDVGTSFERRGSCSQQGYTATADLTAHYVAFSNGAASTGGGTLVLDDPVATSLGLVDGPHGDFRLRPDSPLIDLGDPMEAAATDLAGLPRPVDGNGDLDVRPDIGAYEYQVPTPTPTATTAPTAEPTATATATVSPEPTPAPRTRPKAVRLKVRKVKRLTYAVRATVVRFKGQQGSCEGATARFTAVGLGKLTTTFDAACHADIRVRARPGTRLRARFGGTDTLLPKTSRTVRLRR